MKVCRKIQGLFLVLMTNLFLASCGSGSDGRKKSEEIVNPDVSEYSAASCRYKYDEGPVALQSATPDIKSTYFGKEIDMNLLKPVLAASGAEVVRFAESTGVRYYKTGAKSTDSCEFLATLPVSTADLETEFSNAGKIGTVLGLYLAANTSKLPSTQGLAAIVVRSDASKWVITHEYMHHLFHAQILATPGAAADIKSQMQKSLADYEEATTQLRKVPFGDERASQANETALKLQILSSDLVSVLKQYYLEEMAIETTLAEQMDRGNFTLVLKGQRVNGAAYTMTSAKKVAEILYPFEKEIRDFKRSYARELGSFEQTQLETELSEFADIRTTMASLSFRAKSYLESLGLEYEGLVHSSFIGTDKAAASDSGCGHEKEIEGLIQLVSKLGRGHLSAE